MLTPRPLSPPPKIALWPWRAWRLLYRHLCLGDDLSRIAQDYGYSPDQATGFLQRSTYLCQMHVRVGRKGERPEWQHGMVLRRSEGEREKTRVSCPVRARLATDKAVVRKIGPKLTRRLMDEHLGFNSVLRYYVDNIWQDANQLFFRDPSWPREAIAYLKFLEAIGVKRSQLRFSVLHNLKHCEELERWKVVLGLKMSGLPKDGIPKDIPIVRLKPPNDREHAYDRWIGIEPCFSKSKPAPGNNSTGTYGFRFLMLMGHIVYGATDDEQVCLNLIDELDQASGSPLRGFIQMGNVRFGRSHRLKWSNRLSNLGPKDYLSPPDESGTITLGSERKTVKTVSAEKLLPVIRSLIGLTGPLFHKSYDERKTILTNYLQAASETLPNKGRYDGVVCRQVTFSGIVSLLRWLPSAIRYCDSFHNGTYSLEAFKLPLGRVTKIGWPNSFGPPE